MKKPKIRGEHWKVGDVLKPSTGAYEIGNIAIVVRRKNRKNLQIRFYDTDCNWRGKINARAEE